MNSIIDKTAQAPALVRSGEGFVADMGDHRIHVKVSAEQSRGECLFAILDADFNGGVPAHIHHREDETFHILTGQFEFWINGEIVTAGPGDTVFGPRDVAHSWRCISEGGGTAVGVITPGANFEEFAATLVAWGFDPQADMSNPKRVAELMATCATYGIEMLPILR